jgi:hypothetical protein
MEPTTTHPGPAIRERPPWAEQHRELLRGLSRKYIWWATPEEMLETPDRVAVQVMNMGTFRDVQQLAEALGEDVLREMLIHARAGQFAVRSWHYWHYRLGLAAAGAVPAMPVRHIPSI